jgi:signal transduction histidine kinase
VSMRAPSRSSVAESTRWLTFLLSPLALAPVWFSVLVTVWAVTLSFAITPLVVPLAILTALVVRGMGLSEAYLSRALLGADARVPSPPAARGFWRRAWAIVSDRWLWRAQAYLLVRITVGYALALALLVLLFVGIALVAAPVYYWSIPKGIDLGWWRVDSIGLALAVVPLGGVALALAIGLVRVAAPPWRGLSAALLGERKPPSGGGADRAGARRALTIHALASAALSSLLILVWLLTSHGYFWPVWPMLALGLALGIHAWVVFVNEHRAWWVEHRLDRGFAMHAGTWGVLLLFLIGIWAASGGGYFWPVWPLLAGLIAVGANAAALLLTPDRSALTARISNLEETRAGAVDVQEAELRRIERDLHDGAQARLVALGMSLGMAEQKLQSEPEAARELLADARAGAGEALRELRDLARGIHPPVLADRGLDAAVRALAVGSPISVTVSATVPQRPEPPVESAAYFVVAEALANAGKHSRANRVDVRITSSGGTLSVEVHDDGIGGADPSGNGLDGLRRRVEALDGILRVTSPPGGPTTIRAELPCGS